MLNLDSRPAKRGKPFTEQEKLHLYQCMLPDFDLIDNKAMDSITVVRKADAWRRVTVKFNSDPTVFQRTTEQLKKCFENAKCRKQWVVDSGTGLLQPTPIARTTNKSFQTRNGVSMQEHAIGFEGYEEQHGMEHQLDIIKCELVDIADNSEGLPDETERSSAGVETQTHSTIASSFIALSEYRGQNLLEERLTSNNDGINDLEDMTDGLFLGQSLYHPAQVYSGSRKRPRRRTEMDEEVTAEETTAKVVKSPQMQALEERLLKAQVREAEAAASAAEFQLQLNQLALQHAQAEETRRKQLHTLRVRRLTQLLGDPDG